MNSKRKADLQRKLSLATVPKPPAGLADRIKNDIPEYLRPEVDRARFGRSIAFNMRVAAAVLVMISAVAATVYLLEPQEQLSKMASSPAPSAVRMADKSATDEVQVEIRQEADASAPVVQVASADVRNTAAPAAQQALRRDEPKRELESGVEGGIVGGVVGGTAGGVVGGTALYDAVEEVAPMPAAAPVAPPATIVVTAEAPKIETRAAARMSVGSFAKEAQAADLDLGPRATVFGISVDPGVFHHIKETLEENKRPSASDVNVEAIINYFAGGPVRKVRKGVRLEVEGSPSPVGGIGQRGFLRFSVDTASAESPLPIASNAKLEIDLNGKVVDHASPVGDSAVIGPESALLQNLSVTGLYEIALRPNLRASDRVATIRLTYVDISDGKKKTLEKAVYAREFSKLWTRASRRHRLASLGAVWGQSLRSTSPAPEVARRAEELATQDPRDSRAQELATAATASTKLNSGF